MKKHTVHELRTGGTRLAPDLLGDAVITGGGVHVFAPGETAHPEPRHVHEVNEVLIMLQGTGVFPVDGKDYPVCAGDVVVVEAGEDHHLRSSADDPLVVAWFLTDRP